MSKCKNKRRHLFFRKHLASIIESEGRLFPDLDPWISDFGKKGKNYIDKFRSKKFMKFQGALNDKIPAGYTYLGQFIAHELSFDPKTVGGSDKKDKQGQNLRTPVFDLDSIYGGGPFRDPVFYNQTINAGRTHFLLETVKIGETKEVFDFPRNLHQKYLCTPVIREDMNDEEKLFVPLIPDGRNDENFVLSQIHIAFQLFHNKMACEIEENKRNELKTIRKQHIIGKKAEEKWLPHITELYSPLFSRTQSHASIEYLSDKGFSNNELKNLIDDDFSEPPTPEEIHHTKIFRYNESFRKANQETRWHFQWIVLYDYLPKIVGREMVEEILGINLDQPLKKMHQLKMNFRLFQWKKKPFIPLEFSVAAFRFGHSMVIPKYNFKEKGANRQRTIFEAKAPNKKPQLFHLDWSLFFFKQRGRDDSPKNLSNLIDPFIVSQMIHSIPVSHASPSIVFRNLKRSEQMGLPSGQCIAKAMGEKPLGGKKFRKKKPGKYNKLEGSFPDLDNQIHRVHNFKYFCDHSPLWFYVLMEALVIHDGKKLGPVGGRIVAEVIMGILGADENSFLNQQPDWKPIFYKKLDHNSSNGDNSMMQFLECIGIYKGAVYPLSPNPDC